MVLAALLAPIIAQYDPIAMRIRFRFRPPQAAFPFGTDQFGRDVFSRVVYGTRLSLWIGLRHRADLGRVRRLSRRAVGAVPEFRCAADAGDGRADGGAGILLAIGLDRGARPADLQRDHRALGRLYPAHRAHRARLGAGDARARIHRGRPRRRRFGLRIMLRHLLPNAMGPLLVQSTFVFAYRYPGRGRPELPRRRPAAADAELGQHHRRRPRSFGAGLVDHAVPGHCDQPGRRSA